MGKKSKALQEKEDQLKEYKKLVAGIKRRQTRDINKIEKIYTSYFEKYGFSHSFKESIRTNFLPNLDVETLCENMHISGSKIEDSSKSIKYFCGICWNMIKGSEDG